MDPMTSLPAGIITVLLTDIAGSIRLWEQHPQRMRRAVARHDVLLPDGSVPRKERKSTA
jgi:class 3 adenylate cyclase